MVELSSVSFLSYQKVITAVVAKCHRPGYLENEEEAMPTGLVKLADVCWTQDPVVRYFHTLQAFGACRQR